MASKLTFILSRSYQISTPESREAGLIEESGFEFENEAHDIEELSDLIRKHLFDTADARPITSFRDWLETPVREDRAFFERGEERIDLLHLVDIRDDNGRSLDDAVKTRLWRTVHHQVTRGVKAVEELAASI